MLTPVDQPLDKLEGLTQEEMYVFSLSCFLHNLIGRLLSLFQREHEWLVNALQIFHFDLYIRTLGWIEHFSNKYIICGKLVENDAI